MTKVNILELIRECPDTIISIRAEDLLVFVRQIIAELAVKNEREAAEEETLLCADKVKVLLGGISDSTLYRLSSKGVLTPVWVGGQRRWRKSDINKIINKE